ncbi:hypothetical protein NDU88_005245 [Pleurodeles waltl]|uniref:Uncharacterized protein n=1 Tax=Pleurodeles waltl TaxID=8319 RepID=A0AAV7PGC3_PLEWA|nr:hypothetical protein NDU88_005245 [Pleurodeles waltl]
MERDIQAWGGTPGAALGPTEQPGGFTGTWDDIQAVKKDLSQDLKVVCRELEEDGEKVAALEEHENARVEEIEQLQQEIIWLQDQQIELQAHTEDLENWLRPNNTCIRGTPTGAEEEDILAYARVFFHQILRESPDREESSQTMGEINIEPCALSDHAVVVLRLNAPLQADGPNSWRIRSTLLMSLEVVVQVAKAITTYLKFYDTGEMVYTRFGQALAVHGPRGSGCFTLEDPIRTAPPVTRATMRVWDQTA